MSRVTIRDVARAVGVSHPVVSAVLGTGTSKSVRVSEATRARVIDAANQLGYTPSIVGRGLRQNLSYLVGVLISEVNWMIAVDLMRGIQESLCEMDYSTAVHIHHSPASQAYEGQKLIKRGVDGLLVNWVSGAPQAEDCWLQQSTIPRIELFGNYVPGCASLEVDFKADGAAAVEHLLELGHRRLVLLTHSGYTDPILSPTAWSFAQGYQEALSRRGLPAPIHTFTLQGVINWDTQSIAAGEAALANLLAQPDPPTAAVCFNDYCAYGMLRAARQANVKVPDQLSVVGHFDTQMAALSLPALTTLRIRTSEIGFAAGEMLLGMIQGKPAESIQFPSELIARESTDRPRER
jgi:DNA-binding LacI/PurR family transcriptional regulator